MLFSSSSNKNVVIVGIGNEILYGQRMDTNAQWLKNELSLMGFELQYYMTVGDVEEDICEILNFFLNKTAFIITTGGLGPTKDDLTKSSVSTLFNDELVYRVTAMENIQYILSQRKIKPQEKHTQQAYYPSTVELIPNQLGTAMGFYKKINHCVLMSFPGVPVEMKKMFFYMKEKIVDKGKKQVLQHQFVKTIGIPETVLEKELEPFERTLPKEVELAYLPHFLEVTLRITYKGKDPNFLKKNVKKWLSFYFLKIKPYIYSLENISLATFIKSLLLKKNTTLSIAESCTGGAFSKLITSLSGSSQYFLGSVVTYSNASKETILHVKKETIQKYGAVSQQVCEEMVLGVKKHFNADISLSCTGIAGPDGGTREKPVGTVWIAILFQGIITTEKLQLSKDRAINITFTVQHLVNLIRKKLLP